jgi:hypothetical protein
MCVNPDPTVTKLAKTTKARLDLALDPKTEKKKVVSLKALLIELRLWWLT